MTLEVHVISNRPKLDEFIQYWGAVTLPNINIVIKVLTVDYPEKQFTLNNGIGVQYIKQRTFPKTTYMCQAWARNELLCYSENPDYVLFFDDWQRPDINILIEHIKFLEQGYMVCGQKIDCDKEGNNCKQDTRGGGSAPRECPYGWFWTANASAHFSDIIAVNGFDNRFNGGSAGEDYDCGMRMSFLGRKLMFNPRAIAYHYSHDHLTNDPKRKSKNNKPGLSPYKYLPEYGHYGDWNLMEGGGFEFWWEDGIKYYRYKKSGEVGILDSMQVYHRNKDTKITRVNSGLEQTRDELNEKRSG